MTLLRDDPELERPVESSEQLVDFFRPGEKPASEFRVGTEHEKISLYEDGLQPVPYEGSKGSSGTWDDSSARASEQPGAQTWLNNVEVHP